MASVHLLRVLKKNSSKTKASNKAIKPVLYPSIQKNSAARGRSTRKRMVYVLNGPKTCRRSPPMTYKIEHTQVELIAMRARYERFPHELGCTFASLQKGRKSTPSIP